MKKLFNWTFSAFFRTLGRFLFYLLIGFLIFQLFNLSNVKLPNIFGVLDVHAETNTGPFYQYGVEGISELYAYNWSSYPNSYTSKTVVASYGEMYGDPGLTSFAVNDVNIYTQGVSIVYSPNQRLVEGYLYSIGTIVCFDVALNSIYSYGGQSSMGGNASTALTATPIYQFTTRVRVANEENADCIMYQALIVPQTTGSFYALRMTNTNGYQADMEVWATKVEELGLYTTTVQSMLSSAIQSSGLATASSVAQVQQSVNALDTAIDTQTQQQQENHEEIMNDNIDNDEIQDFVDDMGNNPISLTPFSDFINLPLTWVQSLLASNQSCQTIKLPLPFMQNKTLDLPCMTDFWNRLGSLKTLIEIVWIAIVGVRIFNGLFLLTCDVIDPNPDQDMTKLRTWEL